MKTRRKNPSTGSIIGVVGMVVGLGIFGYLIYDRYFKKCSTDADCPDGYSCVDGKCTKSDNGGNGGNGDLEAKLYIDGTLAPGQMEMCTGEHTVEIAVTNCTNTDYTFEYISWGLAVVANDVTVKSGERKSYMKTFNYVDTISNTSMFVVLKVAGGEQITYPGVLVDIIEC